VATLEDITERRKVEQTLHFQNSLIRAIQEVSLDGILVVDTGTEAIAAKVAAALRKLSAKPILWVVNTSADSDHTGGNEALPRAVAA